MYQKVSERSYMYLMLHL